MALSGETRNGVGQNVSYDIGGEGNSAGPKRGCLNGGAWNLQESRRKAPLSCNAAFSMLPCIFSFAAAQLLVNMTSALQKSQCCSATSAAQHSENCGAASVFACGMLQGGGLGLAEERAIEHALKKSLGDLREWDWSGQCPFSSEEHDRLWTNGGFLERVLNTSDTKCLLK